MRPTTREENEVLTRVGRGSPMGDLLRRYWWPVGFTTDLRNKPTLVRLMGEDLVLFRDAKGHPALLGAKCPHRRANLCLGTPNDKGLRCRYHGWLISPNGQVLETPGEPQASQLKDRVHQTTYRTEELGGLIFAYLGPNPVPLLPRFHILVAEGERNAHIQAFNDCNWLQCVENGIDPFHVSFLHHDVWSPMSSAPEQIWFEETPTGCIYKAIRPGRVAGEYNYRDHPVVLPGIVFGGDPNVSDGREAERGGLPAASARWSVPIDDTHTMNVRVHFRPNGQRKAAIESRRDPGVATRISPFSEYREGRSELGYSMRSQVAEEDATILDSLGPISDRENENLSVIDGGVVLLRKLLLKQIEILRSGRDPVGVIRDHQANQLLVMGGKYEWMKTEERNRLLEDAVPI